MDPLRNYMNTGEWQVVRAQLAMMRRRARYSKEKCDAAARRLMQLSESYTAIKSEDIWVPPAEGLEGVQRIESMK